MDELASMISAEGISAGTRTILGTVKNRADGGPVVTVGGSPIKARWLSGTVVNDGDTVLVQITNDAGGQRTSLVLGRVSDTPTPAVGTVTKTPSGAKSITVRAEWLGELEAAYLTTYTPAVGDQVMLIWHGSTPIAMGQRSAPPPAESQWPAPAAETRPGFITIRDISMTDQGGEPIHVAHTGDTVCIRMDLTASKRIENWVSAFSLDTNLGQKLHYYNSRNSGATLPAIEGDATVIITVPTLTLGEGMYRMNVSIDDAGGQPFAQRDGAWDLVVQGNGIGSGPVALDSSIAVES